MSKIADTASRVKALADICCNNGQIDSELYSKFDVKKGLRDLNGKGVLTGLTEISEIRQTKEENGKTIPWHGRLFYRGYDVEDIIHGFIKDNRFGFEEVIYLLLFGNLPNEKQYNDFKKLLIDMRTLPNNFVRDVVMKAANSDIMNSMTKSVLTLASYDKAVNDLSIENVLRQCLQLISVLPMFSIYGYHAYSHYKEGKSLFIHAPLEDLSIAENILHLLRADSKYTALEAQVLDMALVLHAEHGGGNNSTFTTRVVTSSGTDTYAAIAAGLCSLKGPKHGGANIKVTYMFEEMKKEVSDWSDDEEIKSYLRKLLHKEAFDRAGLIYGMGHAVYSISDPRARVFKSFVEKLSEEKGLTKEFNLYRNVERLAPEVIASEKKIYKGVSANVDFYSGFAYAMLGLPAELYTPIFAIARIAGWSAHRIEELINAGKIIRPAYMSVSKEREYINFSDR